MVPPPAGIVLLIQRQAEFEVSRYMDHQMTGLAPELKRRVCHPGFAFRTWFDLLDQIAF